MSGAPSLRLIFEVLRDAPAAWHTARLIGFFRLFEEAPAAGAALDELADDAEELRRELRELWADARVGRVDAAGAASFYRAHAALRRKLGRHKIAVDAPAVPDIDCAALNGIDELRALFLRPDPATEERRAELERRVGTWLRDRHPGWTFILCADGSYGLRQKAPPPRRASALAAMAAELRGLLRPLPPAAPTPAVRVAERTAEEAAARIYESVKPEDWPAFAGLDMETRCSWYEIAVGAIVSTWDRMARGLPFRLRLSLDGAPPRDVSRECAWLAELVRAEEEAGNVGPCRAAPPPAAADPLALAAAVAPALAAGEAHLLRRLTIDGAAPDAPHPLDAPPTESRPPLTLDIIERHARALDRFARRARLYAAVAGALGAMYGPRTKAATRWIVDEWGGMYRTGRRWPTLAAFMMNRGLAKRADDPAEARQQMIKLADLLRQHWHSRREPT